jgi:gamma-glutamyl hydrolase
MFVALLLFLCFAVNNALNNVPIIGIFTQPSDSKHEDCGEDCLMLAASYVKQVESTGARVVPINFYATKNDIDQVFQSLNGFIFPGGGATLPPAAQYVYDLTIAANDKGDFMPLWGTCLGFEWLLMCTTRDANILDPNIANFDSFNYSIPLAFTPHPEKSKLFGAAPRGVIDILATQNVTFNSHLEGIYPEHFLRTEALHSFYRILSTNVDRKGRPFVSTMEAREYPIFGVQWHPEKNRFE